MPKNWINWKVAGAAGEGVKSTGLMFTKTALRHGLYTFDYTEYPSLIRGGHNTYQVIASNQKVYSQRLEIDLLIALNQNALKFHQAELHQHSAVIVDAQDLGISLDSTNPGPIFYNVPLVSLAKEVGGERVMANNVALGVSACLLSLDLEILKVVIADNFAGKSQDIIKLNQKAAAAGFDYAAKNCQPLDIQLTKQAIIDDLTVSGNEALSLGAVAGGMKAYVAYPMTPSSSILHTLAAWQESANILVKHAEDEIGVINMALGLSYAGIRTAVGTSGGGYCYMTEAIGLSGVAELPVVVYECQRPGPALGMPTWTAQADLLMVINSSQDEFPRVVVAPGDVDEAFALSKLSFTLAEEYQIPVIVLSDKHLSESNQSMHLDTLSFSHTQSSVIQNPSLDESGFFPRYAVDEDGISPRTLPGQPNGFYLANSYEHDIHGIGSEEIQDRTAQMDKRFKKMDHIINHIPEQFFKGDQDAEITFIGWGSSKGALRTAVDDLVSQGINAALLNLSWLWPFPVQQVTQVLEKAACPVIIEGNKTNQLAQLIRAQTGIEIYHKRTKYDGRPLYPNEIVQFAKEILNK